MSLPELLAPAGNYLAAKAALFAGADAIYVGGRMLNARMNAANFTDEELEGAKRSLENGYRQLEDSAGALESYYYGRALAGLEDSLDNCRAKMNAVTREDVVAAAKKISPDTVYFLEGTLDGGEEDADDCDLE